MNRNYEDILHLTHHISNKHPQMPMIERAAQFSPFAALTGYQDAIVETARLTDKKKSLSEDQIFILNQKLQLLRQHQKEHPDVRVTYFQADDKKEGGSYITIVNTCKKIDDTHQILYLQDGRKLPFHDIYDLDSSLFEAYALFQD